MWSVPSAMDTLTHCPLSWSNKNAGLKPRSKFTKSACADSMRGQLANPTHLEQ